MKKILFIGHTYHQKTKSADFVIDLLQEKYDITRYYVDPYQDNQDTFCRDLAPEYDYVICWQIMFPLSRLKKYTDYQKCIFFPMYDGICPYDNISWREYADAKIICFCKSVYNELNRRGFDCEYIQYFPPLQTPEISGDDKSLFFWQRRQEIDLRTVSRLFNSAELQKVHLHKALDPQQSFTDYPLEQNLTVSTWFDKKDDMYALMMQSALYMAPRLEEGIGMSFLEAMSRGRCVIAPDNPTMNEYITDGRTGFLYNPADPQKICLKDIRRIQQNVIDYMSAGYQQWNMQKHKIAQWIEQPVKHNTLNVISTTTCRLFGFIPFMKIEDKTE